MCGIFGHTIKETFDLKGSRETLNILIHRGPDQWGDWHDTKVYLGHRRLSILDLSEHGKQPMISDQIILTANGEIYNFKLLKNELEQGFHFVSNSDSEVLLHGYKKWGIEGLLNRIEGMFAFSIYDIEKQKIFLVRDRVGIKPLYYGHINNIWSWASELKAIEKFYGKENMTDDKTAFYDYLTYLYIPTPKTRYKNIYKLPPAHYLEIDLKSGEGKTLNYWQLKTKLHESSVEQTSSRLRSLIRDSIHSQMISDVPIGFFLSGGLDSSVIVAESSQVSNNINTYTIGFDIESHNEIRFANIIASRYKTNHHTRILSLNEAGNLTSKMKEWYDEPYADTSALPCYLVSKFARSESKVALSGDGGDEIFGGYNWYKRYKSMSRYSFPLPGSIQNYFISSRRRNVYSTKGKIFNRIEYLISGGFDLYTKLLGGLTKLEKTDYKKQFEIPDDYDDYWYFRKYYKPELPLYKRLQYLDFHTYLPDDILTKIDRVSMAVSLEVRVPLLNTDLIEFMFSLPENIIYFQNELKGLLKYAYRFELPPEILSRSKKGFNIPLEYWNKSFLGVNATQQEFLLNQFYK